MRFQRANFRTAQDRTGLCEKNGQNGKKRKKDYRVILYVFYVVSTAVDDT